MGIRIEGIAGLERKLEEIARKMPEERDHFLMQEAELLKGRAADNTPIGKVNGGTLRRNWKRTSPTNGSVEVYNNTEYAAHVEYGHRLKRKGKWLRDSSGKLKFVPGSHMLRDAVDDSKASFQRDAERLLGRLFQ